MTSIKGGHNMRPMNGRAKMEKGAILMEVSLLIVLIGLLHGIAIPNLIGARKSANVFSANASLRILVNTQALFHDQDLDKDGIKNYAQTLKDLGNLQLISAGLATGLSQGYVIDMTTS